MNKRDKLVNDFQALDKYPSHDFESAVPYIRERMPDNQPGDLLEQLVQIGEHLRDQFPENYREEVKQQFEQAIDRFDTASRMEQPEALQAALVAYRERENMHRCGEIFFGIINELDELNSGNQRTMEFTKAHIRGKLLALQAQLESSPIAENQQASYPIPAALDLLDELAIPASQAAKTSIDDQDFKPLPDDFVQQFEKLSTDGRIARLTQVIKEARESLAKGNPDTRELDQILAITYKQAPKKRHAATLKKLAVEAQSLYSQVAQFKAQALVGYDVFLHGRMREDRNLAVYDLLDISHRMYRSIQSGKLDLAKIQQQNACKRQLMGLLSQFSGDGDKDNLLAGLKAMLPEIERHFELSTEQKDQFEALLKKSSMREIHSLVKAFNRSLKNDISEFHDFYPVLSEYYDYNIVHKREDFVRIENQLSALAAENKKALMVDEILRLEDKPAEMQQRIQRFCLILSRMNPSQDQQDIIHQLNQPDTDMETSKEYLALLKQSFSVDATIDDLLSSFKKSRMTMSEGMSQAHKNLKVLRQCSALQKLLQADDYQTLYTRFLDELPGLTKGTHHLDENQVAILDHCRAVFDNASGEENEQFEDIKQRIEYLYQQIAPSINFDALNYHEHLADELDRIDQELATDKLANQLSRLIDADELTQAQCQQALPALATLIARLTAYAENQLDGSAIANYEKMPTPNRDQLKEFHDRMVFQLQADVLGSDDPGVRAIRLMNWLQIAEHADQQGDYLIRALIVNTVVSNPSLRRLDITKAGIPDQWKVKLANMAIQSGLDSKPGRFDLYINKTDEPVAIGLTWLSNAIAMDGQDEVKHKMSLQYIRQCLAHNDELAIDQSAASTPYIQEVMSVFPSIDPQVKTQKQQLEGVLYDRSKKIESGKNTPKEQKRQVNSALAHMNFVPTDIPNVQSIYQDILQKSTTNEALHLVYNETRLAFKICNDSDLETSEVKKEQNIYYNQQTTLQAILGTLNTVLNESPEEADNIKKILNQKWLKKQLKETKKSAATRQLLSNIQFMLDNPPEKLAAIRQQELERATQRQAELERADSEQVLSESETAGEIDPDIIAEFGTPEELDEHLRQLVINDRESLDQVLEQFSGELLSEYFDHKLHNLNQLAEFPDLPVFQEIIAGYNKSFNDDVRSCFTFCWTHVNDFVKTNDLAGLQASKELALAYINHEAFQSEYLKLELREQSRQLEYRFNHSFKHVEEKIQADSARMGNNEFDLAFDDGGLDEADLSLASTDTDAQTVVEIPPPSHDDIEPRSRASSESQLDDPRAESRSSSATAVNQAGSPVIEPAIQPGDRREPGGALEQRDANQPPSSEPVRPRIRALSQPPRPAQRHSSVLSRRLSEASGSEPSSKPARRPAPAVPPNASLHSEQHRAQSQMLQQPFGFSQLKAKYPNYQLHTEATDDATRFAYSRSEQTQDIKTHPNIVAQEHKLAIDSMVAYINQRNARGVDPKTPIRINGKNPEMVKVAFSVCKSLGLNPVAHPNIQLPDESKPEVKALIESFKTLDNDDPSTRALNTLREKLSEEVAHTASPGNNT